MLLLRRDVTHLRFGSSLFGFIEMNKDAALLKY